MNGEIVEKRDRWSGLLILFSAMNEVQGVEVLRGHLLAVERGMIDRWIVALRILKHDQHNFWNSHCSQS